MKLMRAAGLVAVMVLTVVALQAAIVAYGAEGASPLANDSRIWIDPSSRYLEVERGDTFTATVMVENVQDMVGYRIKMDWDSSVVRVTTVTDAGFLLEEPYKDLKLEEDTFSYEVLVIPSSSDPPYDDGADGDGALAVIEMEAWGPGTSPLDLDGTKVEWVDKDEVLHQPTVEDGELEIEMDLYRVFLPVMLRSYRP